MDASAPQLEMLSLEPSLEILEQPPTNSAGERDYDDDATPESLEELTEIDLEPAPPTEPAQSELETDEAGEFESIPLEQAEPAVVPEVTAVSTTELEAHEVEEGSSTTPSLVGTTSTSSPSTEIPTPSDSIVPLPSDSSVELVVESNEEKLARKLSLDAKNSVASSKRRPSVLSGIVSMTRQRDLPPKSKEEEVI